MSLANLHVMLLRTEAELNKANEYNKEKPYMVETCHVRNEESGLLELWHEKFDYYMPGVSNDGVIAIEAFASLDKELGVKGREFATYVRDFFTKVFGNGNVISCFGGSNETETLCHALLFPLNIRQLNPEKWIDVHSEQLRNDIITEFERGINSTLGVSIDSTGNKINNGHTEYLDKFPKQHLEKYDVTERFYETITERSQMHTTFPKDKINSIINDTIKAFTTGTDKASYIKLTNGDMSIVDYLLEAKKYIKRWNPTITSEDTDVVIGALKSAATGFYILDDLLNDPKISDIKICSPWKIRVKVQGKRCTSNLQFIDEADYDRFLKGILLRYGRDDSEQVHVFTDKFSNENSILRNNITLNQINSGYPTYHIRKIPKNKYTIKDLIDLKVMDQEIANYLMWAIRKSRGVIFTGQGASGKTSCMNALIEYIPYSASGLVIQESEELYSYNHPELTFERITGKYDLRALNRNGLLTDIDYFVVGEIKSDEAADFITSIGTGAKGLASIHASSTRDAASRFSDLIMHATKYSKEEAMYMMKELQVIIFMKHFQVAEISEVTGWDPVKKDLTYRTVFRRRDLMDESLSPVDEELW